MGKLQERCLFHNDRLQFDLMQKDLRKSKWIPKSYCERLAMAVCACRKHLGPIPDSLELEKAIDCVRSELSQGKLVLTDFLRTYLHSVLAKVPASDYSCGRYLYILYLCRQGQYDSLSRQALSSNELPEKIHCGSSAAKPRLQRLTWRQIQFIKDKKRKKMKSSSVIILHMYPGNTKHFENLLGPNVAQFEKNAGCLFSYENALNTENMRQEKSETYVKVWAMEDSQLQSVCSLLKAKAVEVQSKSDTEMQLKRQQRRREKIRRLERRYQFEAEVFNSKPGAPWEDGLSKDELSDDFALRHTGKHRGGKKPKTSVYKGGHCLYCQKPYSGLNNKDCRYHSGYIVDSTWTCCDTETDTSMPAPEDHAQSGCCHGLHSWRVHKKANRKSRGKQTYEKAEQFNG